LEGKSCRGLHQLQLFSICVLLGHTQYGVYTFLFGLVLLFFVLRVPVDGPPADLSPVKFPSLLITMIYDVAALLEVPEDQYFVTDFWLSFALLLLVFGLLL